MLQLLLIALAQVTAGNKFENWLNKIRQIIYSMYRTKEITKKVFTNIMNSIKLLNRMDTIFTNSDHSSTFDPHRLWIKLSDKTNLKRSDKYVALLKLSIYYQWKNIKKSYKNNKLKHQLRHGMKRLNWWIIFCIRYSRLLSIYLKKHETVTDNPSIMI